MHIATMSPTKRLNMLHLESRDTKIVLVNCCISKILRYFKNHFEAKKIES